MLAGLRSPQLGSGTSAIGHEESDRFTVTLCYIGQKLAIRGESVNHANGVTSNCQRGGDKFVGNHTNCVNPVTEGQGEILPF
jgi:hypothetical protein